MRRANKNLEDVQYILDHLREEDLIELQTLWGENWREESIKSIMNSNNQVVLGKTKKGDIPVVMGGIWEVKEGVGCAWLLTTPEVKNHRHCLLRELRKDIKKSEKKLWLLYNFIYEKNFEAKKWLKWVGFRFDNPHPEGIDVPEGFEFFYRIREVEGLGGKKCA